MSHAGRCPVRSLSLIPPAMLGARSWKLRSQGGELIPLGNQLSGAVGGRASSALISIVKASLRAVFRWGRIGSIPHGTGPHEPSVVRGSYVRKFLALSSCNFLFLKFSSLAQLSYAHSQAAWLLAPSRRAIPTYTASRHGQSRVRMQLLPGQRLLHVLRAPLVATAQHSHPPPSPFGAHG